MKVKFKIGDILEEDCDVLMVNLFEGVKVPGGATGYIDKALKKEISREIKKARFEGKEGEILVISSKGIIGARKIFVAGLGKREEFSLETIRRIIGFSLKRAKLERAKRVATILHGAGIGGLEASQSAQAITEGALLGSYQFLEYKSKEEIGKIKQSQVEELVIVEKDPKKKEEISKGINLGEILSEATNYSRDLVNEIPEKMTPERLTEEARKIAQKSKNIICKIFNQKGIEKMKMGGVLGVAQGSDRSPHFIHLRYKPKKKSKEKIFLVGKAITFDSGGISLKSSEAMETMKMDMAGGAAILGIFSILPELNINVEVDGVFAACENMPSGKAIKPDDILQVMNGKTIEVVNTDAEGRLTLADSLSYAVKQGATKIIDLATLTGACIVALGDDIAGLFSNNQELKNNLLKASFLSGEKLWELPLEKSYRKDIESKIADIKNVGKRKSAGAIAAALFLKEFIDNISWAHLDIAGPAWQESDSHPYIHWGGTGFGVRTLCHYLLLLS